MKVETSKENPSQRALIGKLNTINKPFFVSNLKTQRNTVKNIIKPVQKVTKRSFFQFFTKLAKPDLIL